MYDVRLFVRKVAVSVGRNFKFRARFYVEANNTINNKQQFLLICLETKSTMSAATKGENNSTHLFLQKARTILS